MAPVFAPFAAATDPFYSYRLSYLTDIQTAEDGTERRVQLRVVPKREVSFLARTSQAYRTAWLDALVYGAQATSLAVPYWPHGTQLTQTATAGSTVTLHVESTTDRDFTQGGYAVAWSHEGLCEEVTITSLTGTTLVVPTLANNYAAGAFVLPSVRGVFRGALTTARLSASVADLPVAFELAHGTDPDVDTLSTAVFTTVPYLRVDVSHDYARQVDVIDSPTSFSADYARAATPVGTRPFRVWVNSRSAAASLVAWFQGVKGRLTAFWLPTYQQDLDVTDGLGTDTLTITRCGYTTYQFPNPSRRRLAFIEPNGTVTNLTVTDAVDNGDGTETLTLSGSSPAGATLTSYLLYGRLASDTLELRWRTNGFADCEMGFVEIPAEAP